jgi:hypothetical protein
LLGLETGLSGFKTCGKQLRIGRRKKEEKEEREEEKKKKKKEKKKKRGDGLYLNGAPHVRHAPTREARKIFWPFLVTRFWIESFLGVTRFDYFEELGPMADSGFFWVKNLLFFGKLWYFQEKIDQNRQKSSKNAQKRQK